MESTARNRSCGGTESVSDFEDPPFVAAAFKFRVQKRVENFPARFRRRGLAGQAKDIRAIMLPRQGGGLFVGHQRGADAGNFVCRDAHADAARAHQQAEFSLAGRHGFRDRLGKIRIIITRIL